MPEKLTEREALNLDLQMLCGGHSVDVVLSALCDVIAGAIGFASKSPREAEALVDAISPDIKASIRTNWEEISKTKAMASSERGSA